MKVTFTEVTPDRIHGVVNNPHFLKSRSDVTYQVTNLSMPFISEKDESDIRFDVKWMLTILQQVLLVVKDDVLAIRQNFD